jgi:16S rRNA (cytosine1407-C5)-methyltransferase
MNMENEFTAYHKRLLEEEYPEFAESLRRRPRSSLRVNTLKTTVREVERVLEKNHVDYAPVPWCGEGLWIHPDASGLLEHQMGFYYVQDAVSMAPALALEPKIQDEVLDLCAAPGSKTTQIAALMQNHGMLVANEQDYRRIRALVYNVQRCGVSNAAVTMLDGVKIHLNTAQRFGRILLDAPCSDAGRAMTSRDVILGWTQGRIVRLSALQKRLASAAYRLLKDDGIMVYSTCTTTLEENEQVVEYVLREFKDARVEKTKFRGLRSRKGLTDETFDCVRILPHYNNTVGYFIARIRKCAKN